MRFAASRRRSPVRNLLERLELRMLLHAGHDHNETPPATVDPAQTDLNEAASAVGEIAVAAVGNTANEIIDLLDSDGDGHITTAQFDALPAEAQALFSPHLVADAASEGPMDYDKLLGIPTSVTGSATESAETLPDFFPKTNGPITLDQTSQPGRTLVRFGTQVNNQGTGPAILISGRPGVDPIPSGAPITSWTNPDGSQNVLQAIYAYNGSSYSLSYYRAAGRFTYHPGHGHFHFDGYAYYRLRYNVGGQPGDYVQRPDGTGVVGEKVGFCLINITNSFTTESGQSSSTLPGFNAPGQPGTSCGLLQGVHVGKADVYSSDLEGQWIDVTGVPNGQYFLEIQLDGSDGVLETNESNNTKTFAYNLNANPPSGGIQPDVFEADGGNDSFETATDLGVMGTGSKTGLTIHWGQDNDYFKFVASSTGSYTVTTSQANGNVDLYLYGGREQLIGSSTKPSGGETVTFSFIEGETYYVRTEAYNSTTSSNYQVAWNLKPETVSATVTPSITENGTPGSFTISRNGPTTSPLTVFYTLTGTAQNGVDYQTVAGSVSLGDLQSTATIDIVPIVDALFEGTETVVLTITPNSNYVIDSTGTQLLLRDAPFVYRPATPHEEGGQLEGDPEDVGGGEPILAPGDSRLKVAALLTGNRAAGESERARDALFAATQFRPVRGVRPAVAETREFVVDALLPDEPFGVKA